MDQYGSDSAANASSRGFPSYAIVFIPPSLAEPGCVGSEACIRLVVWVDGSIADVAEDTDLVRILNYVHNHHPEAKHVSVWTEHPEFYSSEILRSDI